MTKKWRVYMYTFPNGKRYIGTTSRTLVGRQGKDWKHYKNCTSIWEAIQEFGTSSIKQEILFEGQITNDEAAELERKYILQYETSNPEKGYNTGTGGEGVAEKNISDERRLHLQEQMREISKKNKHRIVSPETREKQRLAKLGTKRGPMSRETKEKISKANSRKNMSEATRLNRIKSKQKKVVAINNETGERIVFGSGKEAAEYFDVKSSAVSRWIYGSRKPRNNYTFQFYTTNND